MYKLSGSVMSLVMTRAALMQQYRYCCITACRALANLAELPLPVAPGGFAMGGTSPLAAGETYFPHTSLLHKACRACGLISSPKKARMLSGTG